MFDDLDIHAQLLLYVAGELPEANRERLERELAQNASLRSELQALRDSEKSIQSAMAAMDKSELISETQLAAATRQTARAMRQWHVDRLAQPSREAPSTRRLRMDWRAYSVAATAAAVMAIGFTVWWHDSDHASEQPTTVAQLDTDDLLDQVATAFDQSGMSTARESKIDQLERDLDELRDLTQLSRSNSSDSETQ